MIRGDAGYTLLEVMVALVILALSLSALFENLAISGRISLRANRTLEAVRIANNLFMDDRLMVDLRRDQEAEGEVEGESWKYEIRIEPLVLNMGGEDDSDVEIPDMQRVELYLFPGSGAESGALRFVKWLR
jgi:prepilin-type N-terminal cleavage/methylation domain-containing protein